MEGGGGMRKGVFDMITFQIILPIGSRFSFIKGPLFYRQICCGHVGVYTEA